jgi:hypothetical protein
MGLVPHYGRQSSAPEGTIRVNTRTIAIVALVLVVIVILFLLL